MILILKKFIKSYFIKINTKIETDDDFYDCEQFYLVDLESDV